MSMPCSCICAAITPMNEDFSINDTMFARHLARLESFGVEAIVVAGTHGESNTLSAVERRDLLRLATSTTPGLKFILGTSGESHSENLWLIQQAAKSGAISALVLPPKVVGATSQSGSEAWFFHLADRSDLPLIYYHFPQRTGVLLSDSMMQKLESHPNVIGVKDSSGQAANLVHWKSVAPNLNFWVGDETLLVSALQAGWSGTISGASNLLGRWIFKIIQEFRNGNEESAETKFELLRPIIEQIRSQPQPAFTKALLHQKGWIDSPTGRLPLLPADAQRVQQLVEQMRSVLGG